MINMGKITDTKWYVEHKEDLDKHPLWTAVHLNLKETVLMYVTTHS